MIERDLVKFGHLYEERIDMESKTTTKLVLEKKYENPWEGRKDSPEDREL